MLEHHVQLSFILPCYNVERYLQDCLDSIYSCNLRVSDYEIICVDDCSPDNSISILKENALQHENLRIISHLDNKGLGGARNTGIKEAKGDYIWFVDTDDTVGGNISGAINKASSENLDTLCFNYCRISASGELISNDRVFKETNVQSGLSFIDGVFGFSIVYHIGYVVRFIYRTEFLRTKGLRFPENRYWEDTVFMPKALFESNRVAAIPDVLYSYRMNPTSISGTFLQKYPAKMIFDYSFIIGRDLLSFSESIMQEDYKKVFRDTAIKKYINGFPLMLVRSNHSTRKEFYALVDSIQEDNLVNSKNYNLISRSLLSPIGLFLSDIFSLFYKLKKRI